ncbi:heme oxygenase-like protein [Clathrospora elynae]|uniref:Heme oxygenase-like protein n=1 Tax=Clathrospora elynae TaxID=706981 RepID=A0A6A5SQU0_9PLEO|nr:heme oxygenase-like protein [Clathrospora elynae]
MPTHHPGTAVAHNKRDIGPNLPWAVTTHLLSIDHQQLLRATRHPFLARAAKGSLPKPLITQWLANDRQYLQGYLSTISNLLNLVRSTHQSALVPGVEPDIETRLIAWLESGLKNGNRELRFFQEVAEIYKIDLPLSPLLDTVKSEGLHRYETLFASVASQQPHAFIPWLEGAILLWATEKVYYEAWSWARKQDEQSSPRNFNDDQDGGAMRREFIPNWSNRDFLMFVEQLERIVNEGVSQAVDRDEGRWEEIKGRTEMIWKALLDAEEAFWPDVPADEGSLVEPRTYDVREDVDRLSRLKGAANI